MFLHYITDRRQLSADPEENVRLLLARIRVAAEAGVDAIQLREKDLSAGELTQLALRAVEVLDGVNSGRASSGRTRLLINSRIDVAVACGADGVHLRSDDILAADARAVLVKAGATSQIIGVSCHTAREVGLAAGHGADLAVFGPVFGKLGSTEAAGIEALSVAARTATPGCAVLAIGGLTIENAASCIHAGANGIAGIRIFQSGNVEGTVACLRQLKSQ